MNDDDIEELVDIYGPRPVDPIVIDNGLVSTGLVDIYWREILRRKDPIGFVRFEKERYYVAS